jgi:hypothetical protein
VSNSVYFCPNSDHTNELSEVLNIWGMLFKTSDNSFFIGKLPLGIVPFASVWYSLQPVNCFLANMWGLKAQIQI